MKPFPFVVPVAIALLLIAGIASGDPLQMPDSNADSVDFIKRDLAELASQYAALQNPERVKLTTIRSGIKILQIRCDRLDGDSNPALRSTIDILYQFEQALDDRSKMEGVRRRTELKPYVFGAVSGPSARDGGLTDKGATYLLNEVNHFIGHYRQLEHSKYSNNEVYLTGSRGYFRRTIDSSISTAKRRIDDPIGEIATIISGSGGLVYDNYSPRELLQWALNVTRVAQYFEARLGGSPAEWQRYEAEVRALAKHHALVIK